MRKKQQRGFALLVAIVLSAVAAAVTIALTTLAYKGLVLASSAQQSQYAFYGADTALECALYWDNGAHTEFVEGAAQTKDRITCDKGRVAFIAGQTEDGTTRFQSAWFPLTSGKGCGRITVYKDSDGHSELYGDGVANATCLTGTLVTNPRSTERGIKASY